MQVARLDPIKNHRLALEAVQQLIRSRPDVQFWIVGEGPERPAIKALCKQLQLESHVKLLGERRDVPELWNAADAAVLTSHSEGIPLVLIEAMAAGLPVAATNVGGIPEIVTSGAEGQLTAPGDADALAAQLEAFATSPELRERMGAAGRRRAEGFTEDRMISSYERLYRSMVAA
jgi:glycosyltransferase involved in cell wall biosynthesis